MWFHSIFGSANPPSAKSPPRSKRRRSARQHPAGRLQLEPLEVRCLLSFTPAVSYPVGVSPQAIATGDFNGDGKADMVTANAGNGTVSVLFGNGNGAFQPALNLAVGFSPRSVAVGDFKNNGKTDIVVAGDSHVAELLSNGDGTFQPPLALSLPGQFPPGYTGTTPLSQDPLSVAVGDLNSDGKLDLVVTAKTSFIYLSGFYGDYSQSNGFLNVLLGNGDGTFLAANTTPLATTYPGSVAVADLDGDNKPDIAIANGDSGSVSVFLGKGDGSLQTPTSFSAGANDYPVSVAVGDVNNDGKLDLVTANNYGAPPYYNFASGGNVSVLLGNGNGVFQSALNLTAGPTPQSVAVSDFNKDGKTDFAVVNQSGVTLLLGNGNSTFQSALNYAAGTGPGAAVGDFNGDGYADLVVADQAASDLSVLLNAADWSTIGVPTNVAVSGFPSTITAGVPGNVTVTVRDSSGNTVPGYLGTMHFSSSDGQAVLPGNYNFTAADGGTHSFSATLKTGGWQALTATDTTTASLTGSDMDIGVLSAAASRLDVRVTSTSGAAGTSFFVYVTARDPYNNIAYDYTGTVHFTSTDGQAILPADYTFTTADYGSHVFFAALNTAGNQTITASDTVSSITGSGAVVVSQAASSMNVAGFPSPTTAGASGSFTVTLLDSSGNVVTGYTGTVHFTSSDPLAALPADYTFTSADQGVHAFSATLKTAGTQSISVKDTATGRVTGAEAAITVNPAAASKFVISAPSSISAGVPFSLTITVEDAYGNVITGYIGTVHFKSNDKSALLPADYTFTAADNGVHTFTGLVLKKKGNDTITITDTHNSNISGKAVVNVL